MWRGVFTYPPPPSNEESTSEAPLPAHTHRHSVRAHTQDEHTHGRSHRHTHTRAHTLLGDSKQHLHGCKREGREERERGRLLLCTENKRGTPPYIACVATFRPEVAGAPFCAHLDGRSGRDLSPSNPPGDGSVRSVSVLGFRALSVRMLSAGGGFGTAGPLSSGRSRGGAGGYYQTPAGANAPMMDPAAFPYRSHGAPHLTPGRGYGSQRPEKRPFLQPKVCALSACTLLLLNPVRLHTHVRTRCVLDGLDAMVRSHACAAST